MARRKTNKAPIIILLVVLLLVAAVLAGMIWFVSSHFFVGGKPYANDAEALDLRGSKVSVNEYEAIRTRLPQAQIRWDIPFQGKACADDTVFLTVSSLSREDLEMLAYFEKLEFEKPDRALINATVAGASARLQAAEQAENTWEGIKELLK
jgi:hypothetical protein